MNTDTTASFLVGGVPEHFNAPWHITVQNKTFEQHGLQVDWQTFHDGSGGMIKALNEGEIDVVVILTETIIRAIVNGCPVRIVSNYVDTPLTWGVHVNAQSNFKDFASLRGKKFAISRHGSGSHLMALMCAEKYGWDLSKDIEFIPINHFISAPQELQAGTADVFFWEKSMMQPNIEKGIIRRVAEYQAPWPAFVFAAHEKVIEEKPQQLKQLIDIIQSESQVFMDATDASCSYIEEHYTMSKEDTKTWFNKTKWSKKPDFDKEVLRDTVHSLHKKNILPQQVDIEQLYHVL